MSKNPFLNALAATVYIVLVASFMYYGPFVDRHLEGVIIPIVVLSLFVFSAATMGFIFLYQPFQLFLEDRKKESVSLFLKTMVAFAGITVALVATWFFLSTMYY